MVGCHNGIVRDCTFRELTDGGVQAKGGSANIRIESSRFTECGIRAINGRRQYRPEILPSAQFLASSDVFTGGTSAISFAGEIPCLSIFRRRIFELLMQAPQPGHSSAGKGVSAII